MKKKIRPELVLLVLAIVLVFGVILSQAALDRSDAALYSSERLLEKQAHEVVILHP